MALSGYPTNRMRLLGRELLVIALAAAGGAAFLWFGIPAPWLSGGMVAVVAVGMMRPPTRPLPVLRRPWFEGTMLLSGAMIGSAATPEALAVAARYPGSIAVLYLGVAGIILITGAYLRYVARWSWLDAVLAAAPGALSTVISVAQEKGADIGRIAAIQLFRLIVLVALLPSAMKISGHGGAAPATAAAELSLGEIALVLSCGLVVGLALERLRVTSPVILGSTLASAVLHGTGVVHGTLPPGMQVLVYVLLGAAMGGRSANVTRKQLAALFPIAVGGLFVSVFVAFAFAWPAAWLAGVPYATAMAAFAPGALEAMAVLAFAMGLDPLYVGAHHLARFLLLGLAMPFIVALLPSKRPETTSKSPPAA